MGTGTSRPPLISIWLKIVYTLYVCMLVPVYWVWLTPVNFLWASDLALLVLVPALWLESRLLAGMMALAVLVPEILWIMDLAARLLAGVDAVPGTGTRYIFEAGSVPRYVRTASLFHLFLPAVLVWTVYRLGYARRALVWQTLLAWLVLPLSYATSPVEKNVNWVYGLGAQPQTWLPGPLWVLFLMVAIPLVFYVPTHFVLKRYFVKN